MAIMISNYVSQGGFECCSNLQISVTASAGANMASFGYNVLIMQDKPYLAIVQAA